MARRISFLVRLVLSLIVAGLLLTPFASTAAAAPSQVIRQADTPEQLVVLTFDAGSDLGHTYRILEILRTHGIKATFFLTGRWVDDHPQAARDIVAAGHELGNHTYSHPDLTAISDAEVQDQLARAATSIERATGLKQSLFRPPFGAYDQRVLDLVGRAGFDWTVMWTVDSLDWKEIPAAEIRARVLNALRPGAIVLMHLGSGTQTPQALELLIQDFRHRGYQMATVGGLLTAAAGDARYHTVQPGETLWGIARLYGVPVQRLATANNIADPALIYAGQRLLVPAATSTYVVQPGDTLYSIARRHGSTAGELARINGISDPNRIYAGQRLQVPGSGTVSYVAKAGDTLWGIAQKYGTAVATVAAVNGINNPDVLYPGQVLAIPA